MRDRLPVTASVVLAAMGAVAVAHAEEPPAITRSADVVIENTTGAPIVCGLLFAHWYRQDFAAIEPGSRLTLPFRYAAASGAVYVINSVQYPMAVEDLFCAPKGADWNDVSHLDYRTLAGTAAAHPVHLGCLDDGAKLACENVGH